MLRLIIVCGMLLLHLMNATPQKNKHEDSKIALKSIPAYQVNPFAVIGADKELKIKFETILSNGTPFFHDSDTSKKEYQTITSESIISDGRPFFRATNIFVDKGMPYSEKFKKLQSLRYEVFSLQQQLGEDAQESIPYGNYIEERSSAKKYNAIAQSYNDALEKSGLFVGLSIGTLDIFTSGCIPDCADGTNTNMVVTRISPIVYGLNGGYQKFFNHYVGTRIYGGIYTSLFSDMTRYNISNGETTTIISPNDMTKTMQSFYALAHLSIDLLFEFPLTNSFKHYIGGFMGLNVGIMYYRPYQKNEIFNYDAVSYIWNYNLQVDYSFNLGVNLTIFNAHRIEFGLILPVSYLTLPGFAESANVSETIPAQFWRSAIFSFNYKMILHF